MLHLIWLLACTPAPPEKLESVPSAPTVELGGDKPQSEITWATLKGLLPEGEPAIPAAVGARLGQAEPEARAAFEAARHKTLQHPADQEIEGVTVVSGRLAAFPEVGASLMLRDGVVEGIDLSLPRDEALFAANQVWGRPDDKDVGEEGVPRPVWLHDGVRAVLLEVPDDASIAILKFTVEG